MGNYFFIDGSALRAQIRFLQRVDASFVGRKLSAKRFVLYFMHEALPELHGRAYKRAIFYFPNGDETAAGEALDIPDPKEPGLIRDIHFKYCGSKLKKSTEFDTWVETIPSKFQSRFAKSEKGIDIEMCCDALRLASAAKVDRLFLFTNDSDFIPFCRTVKEFGVNISILHLTNDYTPNFDLLQVADSYDVVAAEALQRIFVPEIAGAPPAVTADEAASAQKSEAQSSHGTDHPESAEEEEDGEQGGAGVAKSSGLRPAGTDATDQTDLA